MITIKDLKEAIAECQGERNPNANTCMKLAAYYIILNELTKNTDRQEFTPENQNFVLKKSESTASTENINYRSDTDFAKTIDGKKSAEVWAIMDELMTVLQAVQPRLYDGVMRKIQEI